MIGRVQIHRSRTGSARKERVHCVSKVLTISFMFPFSCFFFSLSCLSPSLFLLFLIAVPSFNASHDLNSPDETPNHQLLYPHGPSASLPNPTHGKRERKKAVRKRYRKSFNYQERKDKGKNITINQYISYHPTGRTTSNKPPARSSAAPRAPDQA